MANRKSEALAFAGGALLGAGAVLLMSRSQISKRPRQKAFDDLAEDFGCSADVLELLSQAMEAEMQKGLRSTEGADIKMLPSFVTSMPTGKETGSFLALDLGGSNFRVLQFDFDGKGSFKVSHRSKKRIPDVLLRKTSRAEDMFDFIAKAVAEAPCVQKGSQEMSLGFTFSFPTDQTALDKGTLIHWTKGFETSGVQGNDIVELLQGRLKLLGVNVHVSALVNDTVGTLVAHAHGDSETVMGVILGTGSNACYIEKQSSISKLSGGSVATSNDDIMIINMEWGGFDPRVIPGAYTRFDATLDRCDEHPGQQIFEKMISGRYLGELARLVFEELVSSGVLLSSAARVADKDALRLAESLLKERHAFTTPMMSLFGMRKFQDQSAIEQVLGSADAVKKFNALCSVSTLADKAVMTRICRLVSTRAARLSAAGIATVLRRGSYPSKSCTVAVDGSVFEQYPGFKQEMEWTLSELFDSDWSIKLALAEDGSGKGAAMIAAIAAE